MILIINNRTALLPELKEWLKGNPCLIKEREEDWGPIESYSHIIISGGHDFSVVNHAEFYKREIDLIKKFCGTDTAIIGICLGFELIAYTFGSDIELLQNRESGEMDISVIKNDLIFRGIQKMRAFESHRWTVKKLGSDLEVLAKSKGGIESIRHKSLPIYGFQFHPEVPADPANGKILLSNVLSIDTSSLNN